MNVMNRGFDEDAQRIVALLPIGPRVAVVGSTDFWHPESERTCAEIGRILARMDGLLLLTGGVEGVGETVGRSFFQARKKSNFDALVYHILPHGEEAWDYGFTLFAGSDMTERREVLGRLSGLYLVVEGGPGTVHEVNTALANGATVVPIGRSGGHASEVYARSTCPAWLDIHIWNVIGAMESSPDETANAACRAIASYLESAELNQE